MDKFTTHSGTVMPLRRSDVDTDQIIPAVYLKRVTRTGFEDGLFSAWRDANPGTGPWLLEILGILEGRPADVPAPIRRERVVDLIMLMTAALAERARAIESDHELELDEPTFEANLTDVLVGILEAPVRGPLPALRAR